MTPLSGNNLIVSKVLRERGIGVLPDVYANGGGVIVSFFEWVQNQQTYRSDTPLSLVPRLLLKHPSAEDRGYTTTQPVLTPLYLHCE